MNTSFDSQSTCAQVPQLNQSPQTEAISFTERLMEVLEMLKGDLALRITKEKELNLNNLEADLEKAIHTLEQRGDDILNVARGKDIIVSFGNTGAGKSTLCNLLIGNLLVPKDGKMLLLKTDNDSFTIGQTSQSETLLPQLISANGIYFIDLPGLGDTRGPGLAFLNAVCIKLILTSAKSVKFIFVQGQGSFQTQRAASFKKLLGVILKIIPHEIFIGSSALILTKTNLSNKPKDIRKFLKNILEKEMFENLKKLFRLQQKNPPIALFSHANNMVQSGGFDESDDSQSDSEEEGVEQQKFEYNKISERDIKIQQRIKASIQKVILNLESVKIGEESFNSASLLNQGTEELISLLIRRKCSSLILNTLEQLQKLSHYSASELKSLNQNLEPKMMETFDQQIKRNKIIQAIKNFDSNLANESVKENMQSFDQSLKTLKISIAKLIATVQCQQARKKTIEAEKSLAQKESNIENLNQQLVQQQAESEQNEKRLIQEIENAVGEEKDKWAKELKQHQKKSQQEKKQIERAKEEQIKAKQKQMQDLKQKTHEQQEKFKEKAIKQAQERAKRDMEIQKRFQRLQIKASQEHRKLVNKIEYLNEQLRKELGKLSDLQDFHKNRSAGAVLAKIFSFGIAHGTNKKKYNDKLHVVSQLRDQIRDCLQYYRSLCLGQKHSLHDEYL